MEIKLFIKFGKYVGITLIALLVFTFVWTAFEKMDEFIGSSVPFQRAIEVCALTVAGVLTSLVCYSISIASFLAFRRIKEKGISSFFKTLLMGLVLIIPLSAGIYFYDWNIRPKITMQSAECLLKIRLSSYPNEIGDTDLLLDMKTALSNVPGTSSRNRILLQTDSLKVERYERIDTCEQMLAMLPDSMAAEAYNAYMLKDMGVTYQCAPSTIAITDSLVYLQNVSLYQEAILLNENKTSLEKYTLQNYVRTINTLWLYVAYLMFALLGYILRYKPIRKILAVLAVLIIALYGLHEVTDYGRKYAQSVSNTVRMAKESLRKHNAN